ncbi:hypothetical protein KY284_022169 [Solanum tuberosum]|nr:hypothetical protein KY284_022169 [Solanum tuberosum]
MAKMICEILCSWYTANISIENSALCNVDGDFLIVHQKRKLSQRKGYVAETFGTQFQLPDLGTIGDGEKPSPITIIGKKSRKNGVGGSITLREESGVKKKQTHVNAKSILKLEHINDIATWASGEGSIPSLGAFFGQRLAVSAESLGVPPDPSLFACQRGYSKRDRIRD